MGTPAPPSHGPGLWLTLVLSSLHLPGLTSLPQRHAELPTNGTLEPASVLRSERRDFPKAQKLITRSPRAVSLREEGPPSSAPLSDVLGSQKQKAAASVEA